MVNYIELSIELLNEAKWNYKTDNEQLLQKLTSNLKRNGQIENIIVREIGEDQYEVVNGNHRLKAMKILGLTTVVCYNLGAISEKAAKRVAVETNETRFDTDNTQLSLVIKDILTEYDIQDLEATMPYEHFEIQNLAKLVDFDWQQYDTQSEENIDEAENTEVIIKIHREVFESLQAYKNANSIKTDSEAVLRLLKS